MNSMYLEDKRVSVYSLGTQFIYAWASLLSSYLEGQCEGLDPWDGNKAGSHAFILYLLLIRESEGRQYHYGMLSSILSRTNRQHQRRFPTLLASLAMACVALPAQSQEVAIKTNLLYDATATVNLGAEVQVAPKWSLDLSGNLNAWTFSNGRRWKHWMVQPEARYWLCDAMAGHFFAVHALGGQYNIGHLPFARDFLGMKFSHLQDNRYQGWYAGAGIAYGYTWILGKHWNLEAELGLGWIYSKYDIYECAGCGRKTGHDHGSTFAPTKAAINLVYVF